MDMKRRYELGIFPYGPMAAPNHIRCKDCGNNGWGPMLTTETWNKIVPVQFNHREYFLCEICMIMRLDRALEPSDLRDCRMNHHHRLYVAHGID